MVSNIKDLRDMENTEIFGRIKSLVPAAVSTNRMIIEQDIVDKISDRFTSSICNLYGRIIELPDTDFGAEVKEEIEQMYCLNLFLSVALKTVMED